MALFSIPKQPFAHETFTADGTVKTLTQATFDDDANLKKRKASGAFITVETESVIATFDGTTPVASTTGHTFLANDVIVLETYQQLLTFKFTKAGANNARVGVTYFRT